MDKNKSMTERSEIAGGCTDKAPVSRGSYSIDAILGIGTTYHTTTSQSTLQHRPNSPNQTDYTITTGKLFLLTTELLQVL